MTAASRRFRVLVAEERDYRLESIAWLFIKAGFRVTGVGGGSEALLDMMVERPDLVILDLDGQAMSGWQVLDVMQRMGEPIRTVPTIVISEGPSDRTEARNFVLLAKPVSHEVLLATVQGVLSASGAPRPHTGGPAAEPLAPDAER